jgi:ribosomal protein L11
MVSKYLEVMVKLNIIAMEATNKEPIGPTLGQYGVPTDKFCEAFNNLSNIYLEKVDLRTKVYIYSDKTFELKIRVPAINSFIKSSLIFYSENNIIDIYKQKKKPGFFFDINEFIPALNKNIIYTIVLYLLSVDSYDKIKAFSLFKKIKSSLLSQGILYIN